MSTHIYNNPFDYLLNTWTYLKLAIFFKTVVSKIYYHTLHYSKHQKCCHLFETNKNLSLIL